MKMLKFINLTPILQKKLLPWKVWMCQPILQKKLLPWKESDVDAIEVNELENEEEETSNLSCEKV